MAQLITPGISTPPRPGQDLARTDLDGGIFVSRRSRYMDTEIPGELHQLVSGDMNADGQDDLAGINDRDGTIWFTFNFCKGGPTSRDAHGRSCVATLIPHGRQGTCRSRRKWNPLGDDGSDDLGEYFP